MKRYEYDSLNIGFDRFDPDANEEIPEEVFDAIMRKGWEGWRVVAVVPVSEGNEILLEKEATDETD